MKKLILLLFVILFLPFASAIDGLGDLCLSARPTAPHSVVACEKQTEFIHWASVLSDADAYVMGGVRHSTKAFGIGNSTSVGFEESSLNDIAKFMLMLANAFVTLILVFCGYMWITSGGDAKKRNKAKTYLMSVVYMLIFINSGFFIADIAQDLSQEITFHLDKSIGDDFFNTTPWNSINANSTQNGLEGSSNAFSSLISVSPILLIVGWLYIMAMYLRNILITLLLILSPLIVLLFFFYPTKAFGRMLVILYCVELFLPLAFFPLFRIANLMMVSAENEVKIMIIAATLFVAVTVHILVALVAVFKSIKKED